METKQTKEMKQGECIERCEAEVNNSGRAGFEGRRFCPERQRII